MRDYDGRILKERAGVMSRANDVGAEDQLEDFDRTVAYYDEAELEGGGSDNDVSTSDDGSVTENQGPQGSRSGVATSGRANDIVNAPPDDIPSGDNDDVVARQIREAAMTEQDPELREALWEEYRKYKKQ